MSWRAISIGGAGLWAIAASAQTQPQFTVMPQSWSARVATDRALRDLMKNYRADKPAVCSIPLTEVPVAKGIMQIERMPILRPARPVEPMPSVLMPAPPCKEEKR